jgi:predicted ATPase
MKRKAAPEPIAKLAAIEIQVSSMGEPLGWEAAKGVWRKGRVGVGKTILMIYWSRFNETCLPVLYL